MALFADDVIWIVVVGFIIAFILAFGIGANDVANSFGTSVGSKALTLTQACILASIFETLGSVLLGAKVSDTIRGGIIDFSVIGNWTVGNASWDYKVSMFGQLSALGGSCIWLLIATFFKLPVSGSHSIVGAVVGYIIVAYGAGTVRWMKIGKIVLSWFISPAFSGTVSVILFYLIKRFILDKSDPLEPGLSSLPFIYGFTLGVNCFSVLFGGSALLHFDKIPWWGCAIASVAVGIITAIIIRLFLVPWQRRKILEEMKEMEKNESTNHSIETIVTICSKEKENSKTEDQKQKEIVNKISTIEIQEKPEQLKLFVGIQTLTAIFSSFSHGGNDVSNAVGPIVGLWLTARSGSIVTNVETPIYLLAFGGFGITMGLCVLGRRVIETLGKDLTKITPSSGACIEMGAALTVLVASNIFLPISTTHCMVGSVVFVGWYRSRENVNWKVLLNIVVSWFVTLPASALFSAAFMFLFLKTHSPSLI